MAQYELKINLEIDLYAGREFQQDDDADGLADRRREEVEKMLVNCIMKSKKRWLGNATVLKSHLSST